MSVARSVENAAETVAALSGTIADTADTVDEVLKTGRSLLKKLFFGFVILAAVGVVVKMLKGHNTPAEPAHYKPMAAVPEPEAPVAEATDGSEKPTES